MPIAAAIAAALTDHSPHPFGLFLGGNDVSGDVNPTDIRITEAGPGAVSSMDFTVDDPGQNITIMDGTEVQFWDLATNNLKFRGIVDHWSVSPDFGGQGRTWTVGCAGVEIWLDWIKSNGAGPWGIVGQDLVYAISVAVSAAAPFIRAPMIGGWVGTPGAPYTRAGSFTYPVGFMSTGSGLMDIYFPYDDPVFAAGSLRQIIQAMIDHSVRTFGTPFGVLFTLDFYMGLRVWEDDITQQPDDYTTLAVVDTYASTMNASHLEHAAQPGDVIREVYVTGSSPLSSGWFSDGSGIKGQQQQITDTSIPDITTARIRAQQFMLAQSPVARGKFLIENFTPVTTVHAGSLMTITDAATGATGTYRIYQIDKTFTSSGLETWIVSYGGLRRSAMLTTRRLTRTLNY